VTEGPQREELRDQEPDVRDPGVQEAEGDTEEIDAIPVPAGEGPTLVPAGPVAVLPRSAVSQSLVSLRSAPAVQAAAVAAGGFVAGAAMVGLARRRRGGLDRGGRRVSRAAGRGRRGKGAGQGAGELLQIVGSRSLLVDVHLLGSAGRGR
jgi:hypothetical protein